MTDFLGRTEIVALQSDGYNAYTFLDNELTDIEHICCMAHIRAKFKKTYDQGKDILQHYWNQLFVYLKDGLYSIDNYLTEQSMRPITVERKNAVRYLKVPF